MKVILHAGVHCTDEDRILKGLLRNVDALRRDGVIVPGPARYRTLLSEVLAELSDAPPAPGAREVVLDEILFEDPDTISRLVLSQEHFFCVPKLLLNGGRLYRKAEERLTNLCRLFEGDEVELFLGLRDPATFLPAVLAATPHPSFADLLNGFDPMHLRWWQFIERLRQAAPQVKIILWCNEETPIIWGAVLRALAGLPEETKISGAFDMLSEVMEPEGMRRFRAYLAEHPTLNEPQKRKVMIAFLDKYALEDEIEEELDLPGWSGDYVERLSALYDEDIDIIRDMDGVRLIEP